MPKIEKEKGQDKNINLAIVESGSKEDKIYVICSQLYIMDRKEAKGKQNQIDKLQLYDILEDLLNTRAQVMYKALQRKKAPNMENNYAKADTFQKIAAMRVTCDNLFYNLWLDDNLTTHLADSCEKDKILFNINEDLKKEQSKQAKNLLNEMLIFLHKNK
ncbi:33068_t:CDS:2 [Gigaspora margarita]|uniref:33068_t:CDS:1 n=1 Tax=Gigaspora margarita TaxID=4874 RepID=A0ABN7VGR4_GIGMA|nr:33068_t:CDS:2 [Gigaspora margarita]